MIKRVKHKFFNPILKTLQHSDYLFLIIRKLLCTYENQIIFNISNIKFINYLNPILKYLDKKSYAFQTGSNDNLALSLKKNFDVIEINHRYKFFNHIFSSNFLLDFLELLKDIDNNLFRLQRNKPKCIVTLEGNAPQDIIVLEVAKSSSMLLHTKIVSLIHNGFRNMNLSEYFVWGKEFKPIKKHNPNQKFFINGSLFLSASNSQENIQKLETIRFFHKSP